MASFHDSAIGNNDASGTTLATTDALAVTAGDLIVVFSKWEDGTASTLTVDTGASTATFSVAVAKLNHATSALSGAMHYGIATVTGTLNPRQVLGTASDFRWVVAMSFTPGAGQTWALGAINSAQGNSGGVSMSAGTAAATGAGVGVTGFAAFSNLVMTPGAGWSEPAEFTASQTIHAQHQVTTVAGTLTGSATTLTTADYVAELAFFAEISLGGGKRLPQFPNRGALRQNYGARMLGFKQGIASAASTTTLDISTPGSITLAGQSVTMGVGVALSTQGSITLAGQSVTLGLGVAPGAGAITLAGQSVTSGLSLAVSTQGSISLNGQALALAQGTALAIDIAGSIALAGQSVAMNLGIAPGAGSITIAGQSVTLAASGSQELAIDVPGSISLLGQAMGLFNSTPVDVGSGGGGGGGGLGGKWEERSTALRTVRHRKRKEPEEAAIEIEPEPPIPIAPVSIIPSELADLSQALTVAPVADWADRLLSDQRLRRSIGDDARKIAELEQEEHEAILALMILLDEDET